MTMKSSVEQMNNVNILTLNSLLIQYLVLFWFTQLVLPVQCENKYYCNQKGCKFTCHDIPDYSGEVVIDLSSLDGSSSHARFDNIGDSKGRDYKYDWNPCTKFTTGSCQSVYACQKTDSTSYSLGENMVLNYETESHQFVIHYSGGSGGRELDVILNYKEGTEGEVSTVSENEANHYSMTLFTKYAPHTGGDNNNDDSGGGISFGTILCIIFLVVLVLYLGIGIGYKYRNGAQGKDRIPNYEFWANMPGLIKDGCIFSANKTKECVSNARERTGKSEEQHGGGYEEIKNES